MALHDSSLPLLHLIFEALLARVTSESHKSEENEQPDPPKPHEGF